MKTKHGYFAIDNGFVTWYFREGAEITTNESLKEWDKICVFKIDNFLGDILSTDWPHVRKIPDLVTQLKRELVCEHKHIPVEKLHSELICETCDINYGTERNDPYHEDVNNRIERIIICDTCYSERCQDI